MRRIVLLSRMGLSLTHSPTPHLDGRYTIFAEVQEGMRVMAYLQVGDKILDVVVESSVLE